MGQIVDPVTRPSVNSSIPRVRPVFRQLLEKDPTGASWLSHLDALDSRAAAGLPTRLTSGA